MLSGSLREDASEDFSNIEEHLSNCKSAFNLPTQQQSEETPIDLRAMRAAKDSIKQQANAISMFDLSLLHKDVQSRTQG